ncbi:hypothetical protein X975_12141, partial [Stegodyphus mimosarum]
MLIWLNSIRVLNSCLPVIRGSMASTYMPVETILKVDDSELLIGENQKLEQPISTSANYVSIGTQCDWKVETAEAGASNVLPMENGSSKLDVIGSDKLRIGNRHSEEMSLVIRDWPSHPDPSICAEQKHLIPAEALSQQIACNIQALPIDEKFFLQFDYKTRNKLKTKQRRLDPYYRTQERVRQRTVMRIKRQDPRFRAAEREKGRYRMRLKRLDPVFRSQERERQRERMKMKRSDPCFREREREQQKTRLHVKRLDPAYKEKERAQDRLRMRIKRQNNGLYSAVQAEIAKTSPKIENDITVTESQTYKEIAESHTSVEMRNNQAVFPENFNARFLSVKPRDSTVEGFHFKKQHILNFNFYNSSKEQWASHDEMCPKGLTSFSVAGESGKFQISSTHENNIGFTLKEHPTNQKKALKNDIVSNNLVAIKSTETLHIETKKTKSLFSHDTTAIPRFPLQSTVDKLL